MFTNKSISQMLSAFLVVIFLLTGALPVQAESLASPLYASGDFAWVRNIGGVGDDFGNSIAVDSSGNVYTTGAFQGIVDFDPGVGTFNLTSVALNDVFVSKLDSSGHFVWAGSISGGTIDDDLTGFEIAVDSSGNVYITGYFTGTADFDPGTGTFNLTSAGGGDIFVSKLDSSGNFVWAKNMGGTSFETGNGIAVDSSFNVYTTGFFQVPADFDPGADIFELTPVGGSDIFVSKLDSNGDFVWAKGMGGTSSDFGQNIAVDSSNNVYTTGRFQSTGDFDPGTGTADLTSAGLRDIFISKLDSNGDFVWAKSMGGAGNDLGNRLTVDSSGNIFTTGAFQDIVDFDPGAGTADITSAGGSDIFVAKLDSNGDFVWARNMGGTSAESGIDIAVDSNSNVYTTGYFFEGTTDFDPGAGTFDLTTLGLEDVFVSKLDSSGDFVWAKSMGGTGTQIGSSIALDASNNIYTIGQFESTADFDPGTGIANPTSAGLIDIFISKLEGDAGPDPTGPATSLAVMSGSGQSSFINSAFSKPLQVVALDDQSNRISGVTVTFTAPESDASGTFADTGTNTTTIVTNAGGVATTSIFTANNQAGVYAVTASATGLGSVNLNLEQVDGLANDNFVDAKVITSLPFSDIVDITDATQEPGEISSCGFNPQAQSVWYSFTPENNVVVGADMAGSSFSDTNIVLFLADGPGLEGLAFMNGACNGNSLTFTAQAGTTYYIRAERMSGGGGDLHLNLQEIPPPANDDFSERVDISTLPFSATVDITGATIEPDEPQNCSFMEKTVWYSFTPIETMSIRVDTYADGFMNLYRATGADFSDLQHLQCMGSNSYATILAEAGQTYYLQTALFNGIGSAQVNVQQVFPPTNDIFANAEVITSLPFNATPNLTDIGIEPGEPQSCGFIGHSVWYSFTPTETISLRADSQSDNSFMSIYHAPTGSGIADLQDLSCISFNGSLNFLAEAGQTYYLQVGFAFGAGGTTQVNLQQVFPPPNDTFTNAEDISLPFSASVDNTNASAEPGEDSLCSFPFRSLWYTYTPAEDVTVRVQINGQNVAGAVDIFLAVGPGISDLNTMGCAFSGSSTNIQLWANHTYYFRVDTLGQAGTIQFNLQQTIPPLNNNFASPIAITALPFSATVDIIDADIEPSEPLPCYFMGKTVWYSFTPAQTMKVSADTRNSAINGNVNIYRATGPELSDLQFLQCSGPFNSTNFTAEAQQTYYIQAGAAFGEDGTVQVNLTEVTSITGRITNAVTGAPLPFASVTLQKICGDGCFEYVNSQQADSEGRFLFDSYYYGVPLTNGTYQIDASANLYQTKQFGPFEFSGVNLDVGDLSLDPPAVIRGRAVDSETNSPLPNASATLRRCDSGGCFEFVNSQSTDGLGQFQLNSFYYGAPLIGGTYELEISAALHETERIEVVISDGENRDLGDVLIDPLPLIGSIRGRLLDAATGKPVTQTFTPSLQLFRCIDGNCYEFVNAQVPDSDGKFRFETDSSGNPLPVGTYQILTFADQYQQAQSDPFDVGEGMHRTVGNLRITSFPVRFSDLQSCSGISASGGECVFSVRITNGANSDLEGSAWSLVDSSLPSSFAGHTNFQAKDLQELDLDRGKSKVIRFRFTVPANNSSYGSYICTRVFVGQGGNSFFNTVGFRDLFCVLRDAGGFTIASPQEAAVALVQENAITVAGTDIEPNNSCPAAQDVGDITQAFMLDGNLDSSQAPDVDFFRFTGTPGLQATVDLEGQGTGKGTLGDPFLGFFDSNCNLINLNDDGGGFLNSRLEITIPADGIFVLGATNCCDSGFNGGGNGSYQLTITPVKYIDSISGRAIDAATGKRLRGDVAPFAFVRLLQCGQFGCFDVNNQTAGSDGRFRFESDSNGAPLRATDYMVVISADQYQTGQTDVFTVGENENHDTGDVALTSFPVRFSDIKTCVIPSNGGTCDFSVKITNGLSTRLSGKAWSIINSSGIGSFTNFTIFQTDTPTDVRLDPGKSSTLRFRFRVRGSVDDGASICTTVYVGQGSNAFFNTVGQSYLFCFVKGSSGFTLMSIQDTQAELKQMQIQEILPPNTPVEKNK